MHEKLFEPIMIGSMQVPNRLVMAPMVTQYADKSGAVTQRQKDYYAERAKSKVGLIIVEAACVALGGRVAPNQLNIYDDGFVPGLRELAQAINNAGACSVLQLQHTGRRAHPVNNDGIQPVSASAIPMRGGEIPRELTVDEIEGIIESFAQGARRAKDARFDGVELHFAHGYLIAQFLSPLTNKRTDKYGGDPASRARIAVEIVKRVRQQVGEKYPVLARICGDEFIKGGLVLNDTKKMTAMLEEAGVDAIDVSAGYTASHEEGYLSALIPWSSAPMSISMGCYLNLAEEIKKVTKMPVIAVGRLDDPILADEVITKGKADMVAIGRGLVADAAFANKVYHNRSGEIRRCIACCSCISNLFSKGSLACTVNPEVGTEAECRINRATKIKKVVVIGGGPGGMETARVAALRGHHVVLLEKKTCLGGNMVPASAPSFKHDISLFTNYLRNTITKLCEKIYLETEADPENIVALKPDVVILATGASPIMPAIAGIDRKNVTHAIKVLEGSVKTGNKVVIAGGGAVGCEVAAFLAESGKDVSIVEMRDTDYSATDGLAPDMDPVLRRWLLFELWPKLAIDVIGKSTFKEVTSKGLIVEDRDGKRNLVPGDTVVFSAGMRSNNMLREKLQGKVPELYEVGDCVKPRHILEAVEEAARVARQI